jgi:hypothetical protein
MNDKTRPPVPPVRLVSETSTETINAQRQQQEIIGREEVFASALLDLMANVEHRSCGQVGDATSSNSHFGNLSWRVRRIESACISAVLESGRS